MPRKQALERVTSLLELALSGKSRVRERALGLVQTVEENRHDARRLPEAGRALEALARGKIYKALGFTNYAALLASLGISRTRAHVWRGLASRKKPTARDAAAEARAEGARIRIEEQLVAAGIAGRVLVVTSEGARVVRVELAVGEAESVEILTGSKLVAMGVSAASIPLAFAGVSMEAFTDRPACAGRAVEVIRQPPPG
jgi:hypothetical protein